MDGQISRVLAALPPIIWALLAGYLLYLLRTRFPAPWGGLAVWKRSA